MGTCLGIGEGIVVVEQVVTTISGHRLQLVVGQLLEQPPGRHAGTIEFIVGVIHLIAAEDGPQAALVKGLVVGHKGQALDEWFNLSPHVGKYGRIVGIAVTQSMHTLAPVAVVVGFGLDERVEPVSDFPVTHDDNTHRADAGALAIGCLKINCSKVPHTPNGII